jgi:hypothetical protein
VVELEVGEDQRARAVVHELGALVEERRVVLVGLDDEERRIAEARRDAEVAAGMPPIRKPGRSPAYSSIQASMLVVVVLPCVPATASVQRSRSTSRASHAGPESIGQARVQQLLDHRLAAAHHVADHDAVGLLRALPVDVVALDDLDAEACAAACSSADRAGGPSR